MKTKSVSLAPVISECERLSAAAIKHFSLTVKPENLVFTVQTKGKKNALGWFWADRWKNGKDSAVHEINLSAETLRECHPGEVIIHELAHAENQTLGIKDCSGRSHNKKFKTMAERLGLEVKPRDKSVGFGFTDLGAGARVFLKEANYSPDVFSMNRLLPGKKQVGGTRLLKVECLECGYVVRVTQKWLDVGNPVCPCGQEMGAV